VYRIRYDNLSVMVVDNGSTDDSCSRIRDRYPQVQLMENGANLGFAEGNNVGIRRALGQDADYIFLLNNDTIVDPQIVTELLAAARHNDEVGIYGCKIYFHSEPAKIWYSGAMWDKNDCQFVHSRTDITEVAVTDYACGCAMFISKKTLRIIGLMDPVFFLTFEETDWCYRALRHGIRSYCVPSAKVWHKISASFGGGASPVLTYFMVRNQLLWSERNLSHVSHCKVIFTSLQSLVRCSLSEGKSPLLATGLVRLLVVIIRHLVGRYPSSVARANYLGFRDYFFRKFGACPDEVSQLP